ncbi:MAG: hypothetical protein ACM3UP_00540 [Methanocella sp.]
MTGALLLPKGKSVTAQFIHSLEMWGLSSVYVEEGFVVSDQEVPERVTETFHPGDAP